LLSQVLRNSNVVVTIGRAQGAYPGAARERDTVVELVGAGEVARVTLNGEELAKSAQALPSGSGWWREGGRIYLRTGVLGVAVEKRLELKLTP
jgi:hypothetical protein